MPVTTNTNGRPLREVVQEAREAGYNEARQDIGKMIDQELSKRQYSTPGSTTRTAYSELMAERTAHELAVRAKTVDTTDYRGLDLARFAKLAMMSKGDNQRAAAMAKDMYPEFPHLQKALSTLSPSAGGFLVPVEYISDIIPLLRDRAVVLQAGVQRMPMNNGTLEIPKLSTAAQANYGGENAVIVASQESFGNLALTAKKLTSLVPVSNDLLRFAELKVDQIIRDDMVLSMALKMDFQFLRGDGSNNSPLGVRFTPGVQLFSLGDNGGQPDQDFGSRIVELAQEAHSLFQSPGWIMNSRSWRTLYTLKTSTGYYLFRDEMRGGTFEGFPFYITNQLPNNLTKGSANNTTEIYFGDWREAVLAESDQVNVDASTEAAYVDSDGNTIATYARDQTIIRAIARHDFGLRQPTVFVVATGVLPT